MDKTEFLTIYGTFENLEAVKKTLPSVIEETRRTGSRLIVHDSSLQGQDEKWVYLRELNRDNDFFLILSSNLSMAHARNMCLQLGQELYAPDYICMLEDDHGFKSGMIPELISAMKKYYGRKAPNGLLYGLFTGCGIHHPDNRIIVEGRHSCPAPDSDPGQIGRANSCFRCAPTSHWNNVLKGYDTDEYLISVFQTANLNRRNYFKGFTVMYVRDGDLNIYVENEGRGFSAKPGLKRWDDEFTASDKRSRYRK